MFHGRYRKSVAGSIKFMKLVHFVLHVLPVCRDLSLLFVSYASAVVAFLPSMIILGKDARILYVTKLAVISRCLWEVSTAAAELHS